MYTLDQLAQGAVFPIETNPPLHRGIACLVRHSAALKQQAKSLVRNMLRESFNNDACQKIILVLFSSSPDQWLSETVLGLQLLKSSQFKKKIHIIDAFSLGTEHDILLGKYNEFGSYRLASADRTLDTLTDTIKTLTEATRDTLTIFDSTSELIVKNGMPVSVRFISKLISFAPVCVFLHLDHPSHSGVNESIEKLANYALSIQPSSEGPSNPNFNCEILILKNSSKATRTVEECIVSEKGRVKVLKKEKKKLQPVEQKASTDQLKTSEQKAKDQTVLPYEHQGGQSLVYVEPEDSGEMDDDPDDDLDI